MNRYYIDYPRNFANEHTVYVTVAGSDMDERFRKAFPKAERISRKRAIYLGWARPRQAGRIGEQWYGGFARTGSGYVANAQDAIFDAMESTRMRVQLYENEMAIARKYANS